MSKKNISKIKLLTVILSVAMIFSMIPAAGMAADDVQSNNSAGTGEAVEQTQPGTEQVQPGAEEVQPSTEQTQPSSAAESNNQASGAVVQDSSKGSSTEAGKEQAETTMKLLSASLNITTKCTNGTITPNAAVNSGGSTTITYSPETASGASYYLYRVMVDGAVKYIDADGDGTPETGSTDYKSSYTFSNVTENHAISVMYMPVLPAGVHSDADISVNGADDLWYDPFKDSTDLQCTYKAVVYIPEYARNIASSALLNPFMRSLTATVTGVYDPNIDAAGAVATMLNAQYEIVPGSFSASNGSFSVKINCKDVHNTDFSAPITMQIQFPKVANADARANAGGILPVIGQFSGMVGYIDPEISFTEIQGVPVSGQSDAANIHIVPKYTVNYWLEEYDKATGQTKYVLKEKAVGGASILDPTAADSAAALDHNGKAVVRSYDGYVLNTSKSTTQSTIADDNTTVMNLYYDKYVSVSFNSNGGNYTPEAQKMKIGNKASEPTAPARKGYTFKGWYYKNDAGESVKWDFGNPVTADMTLTADWTKKAIDNNGGSNNDNGSSNNDNSNNGGTPETGDGSLPAVSLICMLLAAGTGLSVFLRKREYGGQ